MTDQSTGHPPRPASDAEAQNASILERLKRLEEVVLGSSHPSYHTASAPPYAPATTSDIVLPSKTASPWASEYEEAVLSLEGTGTRETNFWLGPRSKCFTVQTLPIPDISAIFLRRSGGHNALGQSERRSFYLPSKQDATFLLDMYIHYIDNLQHVLHLPYIRTMMDDIYSNYQDPDQLFSGQLALLLAIVASAAAVYQYFAANTQLEASETDAHNVSLFWANSALEMLEISRRTSEGHIEDVQATIVLSFLMYHLEGFSVRTRALFSSGLYLARDLSLHKIDGPGIRSADFRAREDPVCLEVKRRIIWHAVATDWSVSLSLSISGVASFVVFSSFYTAHTVDMDFTDNCLGFSHSVVAPRKEPM